MSGTAHNAAPQGSAPNAAPQSLPANSAYDTTPTTHQNVEPTPVIHQAPGVVTDTNDTAPAAKHQIPHQPSSISNVSDTQAPNEYPHPNSPVNPKTPHPELASQFETLEGPGPNDEAAATVRPAFTPKDSPQGIHHADKSCHPNPNDTDADMLSRDGSCREAFSNSGLGITEEDREGMGVDEETLYLRRKENGLGSEADTSGAVPIHDEALADHQNRGPAPVVPQVAGITNNGTQVNDAAQSAEHQSPEQPCVVSNVSKTQGANEDTNTNDTTLPAHTDTFLEKIKTVAGLFRCSFELPGWIRIDLTEGVNSASSWIAGRTTREGENAAGLDNSPEGKGGAHTPVEKEEKEKKKLTPEELREAERMRRREKEAGRVGCSVQQLEEAGEMKTGGWAREKFVAFRSLGGIF